MSKILMLAAIDHETKTSLGDALDIAASPAVKGKVKVIAASVAARPARKLSTKGLKNGDYAVPSFVADSVDFSEITVKWTYNRKAKARVPYVFIDGEYTPASDPKRRRAVTLITEGVAVPTAADMEVEDDCII